jgi:predicted TPR repeat methyltransferase
MLDKARARAVYDQLHTAELVAYMRACAGAYDLIVSADTLVYFGALPDALSAAAASLRAAGHLIFTVERADPAPADGYQLNPHGRYSHGEDYVRRALEGAGLAVRSLAPVHLRLQGGVPVAGMLVVAQRPDEPSR